MAAETCPVCGAEMPEQRQARRISYGGIEVCDRATCEEAADDRAHAKAAASTLGKLGGASKSKAKSDAARANGAKGGRPRKSQ